MTKYVKSSRKVGRPTLEEQLEIENKLRPYFNSDFDPKIASEKTGISVETVRKHFRIHIDRLRENYSEDLVERQKDAKARLLNAIDNIHFDILAQHNRFTRAIIAHEQEYEQNRYTKEGKSIPYMPNLALEDRLSAVVKTKLDIYDKKASILAAPTIDEQTEKSMLKRFQKDKDPE